MEQKNESVIDKVQEKIDLYRKMLLAGTYSIEEIELKLYGRLNSKVYTYSDFVKPKIPTDPRL